MQTTGRLDRGDGVELAWARQEGRGPTVVFLPGFRSDMTGDKATALAAFCAERGQAMLRFDYSGHGASGGRFEDGTIGRWTDDALAVIDRLTEGPLVLVGSSMGGWIALLAALARPDRVAALIGIAAAPDFTEALMWQAMTVEQRATLMRDGVLHRAEPVRRALSHHPRADRGRTHPAAAECADRARLSGAAAARPGRSRRAVGTGAAHRRARHRPGRSGDPGEGRRSSPVAAAGSGTATPDARPVPRPGWRVVPRDSSDRASAGQVPAASAGRTPCGSPPRSCAPSGVIAASARSNGTASGAATPSSRAASATTSELSAGSSSTRLRTRAPLARSCRIAAITARTMSSRWMRPKA